MAAFKMRSFCSFVFFAIFVVAIGTTTLDAQGPTYHLGRTPTDEEIKAADTAIAPDGTGLPPGNGTAKEGAALFKQKCGFCPRSGRSGRSGRISLAHPAREREAGEAADQPRPVCNDRVGLHQSCDAADEAGLAHAERGVRLDGLRAVSQRRHQGRRGARRDEPGRKCGCRIATTFFPSGPNGRQAARGRSDTTPEIPIRAVSLLAGCRSQASSAD